MKRNLIILAILFLAAAACVAEDVSLSPKLIDKLQSTVKMDTQTKAKYNAISNNSINDLAFNQEILKGHNELFTDKIKVKGITAQKQSGRCWLFAGLNILRPKVIEKYNLPEFEFSQNYLFFWDKLEKANNFLEKMIEFKDRDMLDREMEFYLKTPCSDGGYWENVVNLVEKYGVVPKNVMPETKNSDATSQMNTILNRKLRSCAVKLRKMNKNGKTENQMRQAKGKMLADIYKILALTVGQPPKMFEWRYEDANSVISEAKTYTPQSFYSDFVGVDLGEYVNLFNDPSKEYGKHYQIKGTKNLADGDDLHFANVKIKTMKLVAQKSILDGQPIWFGADVGKDQDRTNGIMADGMYDYQSLFETDLNINKANRSLFRESAPNHAMVLVAVDLKDDKPVKWKVENSWGSDVGSRGYWMMYDSWFDENIYDVIVNKKYVPKEVLDILEQTPEVRPSWDPMWSNRMD